MDVNNLSTLNTMRNLAITVYHQQRKYLEAEILNRECLVKRKSLLGENHLDTLGYMSSLAIIYYDQCKYSEAEILYKEYLENQTLILGNNHPILIQLDTMGSLALTYNFQGKILKLRYYLRNA